MTRPGTLPIFWKRAAQALLILIVLAALLLGVLYWLLFVKDAPRDTGLDSPRWRATPSNTPYERNPRRDMVRSVQRWLITERPTREKVYTVLGPPDGLDRGTDSWLIGCGYTSIFYMDGEALMVEFTGGQASGSHFVQY